MIIEQRDLPYILRECHGQFATWIYITEQYIADSIGSFASAEPYIQDSGYIFLFPGQCQWTASEEGQYNRFSGLQQCFQ